MATLFDGDYDSALSCAVAEEYFISGDPSALDTLIPLVAPLINVVLKSYITEHTLNEDPAVLRSDTLSDVFDLLIGKSVPTTNPKAFTYFLMTRIRWSIHDSIRRSRGQVFDYWKISEDPVSLSNYADRAHQSTEWKIYADQAKSIIKSIIDEDIRFSGKDKKACQYAALCILGLSAQDPLSIQFRFKLTRVRAEMLVQYTKILVKSSTYFFYEIELNETSRS